LLNHTNRNEADADKADLDPKAYVDALLAVHEKNAATVARSFKAEAGFAAALDKACREFVNRNAATGGWLSFIFQPYFSLIFWRVSSYTSLYPYLPSSSCFSHPHTCTNYAILFIGTSAARSPELLAKHADMLLRKSNKVAGDVDLEGALNRVVSRVSCFSPVGAVRGLFFRSSLRSVRPVGVDADSLFGLDAQMVLRAGGEHTLNTCSLTLLDAHLPLSPYSLT
jgi:hypothetical protein